MSEKATVFSLTFEETENGYVLEITPIEVEPGQTFKVSDKFDRTCVIGHDKKRAFETLFEALYLRYCT